jgi:hypothetical protein
MKPKKDEVPPNPNLPLDDPGKPDETVISRSEHKASLEDLEDSIISKF